MILAPPAMPDDLNAELAGMRARLCAELRRVGSLAKLLPEKTGELPAKLDALETVMLEVVFAARRAELGITK